MITAFTLWAMATDVSAGTRLSVPQDTPLPIYAAGLGHTGFGSNDWVGTVFYYPPDTIPGNFPLWYAPVYDYPVGEVQPYVEGFYVWMDGSDTNSAPAQTVLHNVPGVRMPIWFTPAQNFINGVKKYPPYTWTVKSMKAEGSIVGWADFYSEVDETPDGVWAYTVVASGYLEDGRSFWLKSHISPGWWMTLPPDLVVHFGP
jgi:hypothetical protein